MDFETLFRLASMALVAVPILALVFWPLGPRPRRRNGNKTFLSTPSGDERARNIHRVKGIPWP